MEEQELALDANYFKNCALNYGKEEKGENFEKWKEDYEEVLNDYFVLMKKTKFRKILC